ncbi:MAG: STAS domain-containing protein [Solibacillus sp.]
MTFSQLAIADTFEIEHEITIKNMVIFQKNMDKFLLQSKKFMILNLQKVKYLNNSALKIIASAAITAKKNDKELVIVGIRPPIDEIFEIVKFSNFMELFATYDEAIAYFARKMHD